MFKVSLIFLLFLSFFTVAVSVVEKKSDAILRLCFETDTHCQQKTDDWKRESGKSAAK